MPNCDLVDRWRWSFESYVSWRISSGYYLAVNRYFNRTLTSAAYGLLLPRHVDCTIRIVDRKNVV